MYVMTIGDDAAIAVWIGEGGAHHAGLAMLQLTHRIVEMGETAGACGKRLIDLGGRRIGMAERYDDAGLHQGMDCLRRHIRGRQRQQHDAAIEAREPGDIFRRDGTNMLGRVGAGAAGIEERAFDMNAEDARHAFTTGGGHRMSRFVDDSGLIGDDGGQETRRTEAAIGLRHVADARDRGVLIDEHAIAAIHLRVDEARRQHAAFEINRCDAVPKPIGRHQGLNHPIGNDGRHGVVQRFAIENASARERDTVHLVSVTFLSSRGLSGLRPRRRAMRSALP